MREIVIKRKKNLLIRFKPLKVYADDEFVDFIEPDEFEKKVCVDENTKSINIYVHKRSSNTIDLTKNSCDSKKITLSVTSQIANPLFILIYGCFFSANFLYIFFTPNNLYIGLALFSPMLMLIYWETIGRKNYLRLSKFSETSM